MICKKIKYSSFRNIEQAEIEFSDGVNILFGNNAEGKTNALEGIYLFAHGKSFRVFSDKDLINFTKDHSNLKMNFEDGVRDHEMEIRLFRGNRKQCYRNGVNIKKMSDFVGYFRAVLFSPDDLQMVKGSPSERRRFLDIAISQCYPVYLALYARYQKYLEERNALLKAIQKGFFFEEEMLSVYSEKLSALAAEIYLYRRAYVEKLKDAAKDIVEELSSGREFLSLVYRSDMDGIEDTSKEAVTERYKHVFSANLMKEKAAGMTLYGIHRDELGIYLGGISAKDFGSQGQQRSAVLALKMAEGIVSGEICGERPVYLFDDVLSELDEGRRKFLLSGIESAQFIVTGCEKSILGEYADGVNFIKVENGAFYSGEKNAKRFG